MTYSRGSKGNRRSLSLWLDWFHILSALIIVILAAVIFMDPEQNQFLLPFVFLTAGLLKLVTAIDLYRKSGRDKKRRRNALGQGIGALLCFLMTGLCMISLWR